MYNLTLVTERLNIIRNAVKRLKLLAEMPAEEFCRNEDAVDIAENRLRRAIEALFDLGRHLVVKSGAAFQISVCFASILPITFVNRGQFLMPNSRFFCASTTEVSTWRSGIDQYFFSRMFFSSGVTRRKPCFW